MKMPNRTISRTMKQLMLVLTCATTTVALVACGGGGTDNAGAVSYTSSTPFKVGTTTFDANLPAEPTLPTDDQVCATLKASDTLVKRPDGALPPESDPSASGVGTSSAYKLNGMTAATTNPDQARIQAALNACGVAVDAEVGQAIADADAAAKTQQDANIATAAAAAAAAGKTYIAPNISGASGEELAKAKYKASKFAVRLVKGDNGGDAFISGPLTLPSGVTLVIDTGVTIFASRDVMLYNLPGKYCGNTAVKGGAGSSSNCKAFISGDNLVNSAIMGDGAIDSRAYAEIVTTDKNYPMMKVDLTCSNTYAAYELGTVAADGTPCDNGGSFVNSKSAARNMTWWDLAWKGNMVDNGLTGFGSQSCFRMMVFNYAKNLTLYRISMNNSANFHFVPSGIDGLTVWGIKLQTPTLAAFANPAGNGNPLYTGFTFNEDNVKNTDALDPGSAGKATQVVLTTGATYSNTTAIPKGGVNAVTTAVTTPTTSANKMYFDGYLKNVAIVYNYVSTGDDDIVLKGSSNPSPAGSGLPGIDGDKDVRADRKFGIIIAHNHIYWGHGISIGSETNAGVRNVHVYDNSFNGSEEGLRIKSDSARGGEVMNIHYENICIKDTSNPLLFTPYYSTKAGATLTKIPNFHDLDLTNVRIQGGGAVKLMGTEANTSDLGNPQYPLGMTLKNVVADEPSKITMISSDANLTISGVNLPIVADASKRIVVNGLATQAVDPSKVVDCSNAYVDYPTGVSPAGTSW